MDPQPVANLPLASIDPPIALLRMVDKGSVDYLELCDSIAEIGFLCSISVRPAPNCPGRYQILDGLYRFSASQDLGLETIPAIIKEDVTDEMVLLMQVQGNAVGKDTEPTEYAARLRRLLALNPSWTLSTLGGKINKTPQWIKDRLNLLRLKSEYQEHVDLGNMPLGSAVMLSKLPPRFQPDFIDRALTMTAKDFKNLATNAITTYREAVRNGKLEGFYEADWKPTPYLRGLKHILDERENHSIGPTVVMAARCKTPVEGFYTALDWVLNLDRASVEKARQKAEEKNRNTFKEQNFND